MYCRQHFFCRDSEPEKMRWQPAKVRTFFDSESAFAVVAVMGKGREILKLDDVDFIRNGNRILSKVSFTVCEGQHWVVIGPNGAGKTTLVNLLSLYEWPSSGRVFVQGTQPGTVPVETLRQKISRMQPDSFAPDQFYGMKARDVIATGLNQTLGPWNIPEDASGRVERMVQMMNVQARYGDWLGRDYGTLSTGEKRKILLLRAFISNPELLIIDEPFDALDLNAYYGLSVFLSTVLKTQICSSVTVIHRIDEIPKGVTHAMLLKDGQVLKSGPVSDVIRSDVISALYGIPLQIQENDGRFTAEPQWPKNV